MRRLLWLSSGLLFVVYAGDLFFFYAGAQVSAEDVPSISVFSTEFSDAFIVSSSQTQIDQIDQQIEEMKEMKRGYESRAIRAENQADRLQFEDHFLLETRRYYRIADENRQKANEIQAEIDRLEMRKSSLQK